MKRVSLLVILLTILVAGVSIVLATVYVFREIDSPFIGLIIIITVLLCLRTFIRSKTERLF